MLDNLKKDLTVISEKQFDVKYHANMTVFRTTNDALASGTLEQLFEDIFSKKVEVFIICFKITIFLNNYIFQGIR